MENSIKYGGNTIEIKFLDQEGKRRLIFRDNGPGIKPSESANIFDRFYRAQTGNNYKHSGFGIGLNYVKRIIDLHDGKIWLNSTYTDGAEFIIEMP